MGHDTCQPKVCRAPGRIAHATGTIVANKIGYTDTIGYTCDSGYSLTGRVHNGPSRFDIECLADTTLAWHSPEGTSEGPLACVPVECGATGVVEHATVDKQSLIFPNVATYTCAGGHTLSANPAGQSVFTVHCGSDGNISAPLECLPVNCGAPPRVPNAQAGAPEATFNGSITYRCQAGHTTNANASGASSFDATCNSAGNYDGIQSCRPVQCGYLPVLRHAEYSVVELEYPMQTQVVCHEGYSVTGTVDGSSTFIAKCEAVGTFSGLRECQPVSCGIPNATVNAVPKLTEETVYGEMVEWECKQGFSVDGTKRGGTSFQKQCLSSGEFGVSSPSDCQDIDFCLGSPCGANGICADLGDGLA